MIGHDVLLDLTENYLKFVIAEATGALQPSLDSASPFGELGINSFHILKVIKRLEGDFGRLPKTLLFQHFNIADLARYFVDRHEQTLISKFDEQLQTCGGTNGTLIEPAARNKGMDLESRNGTQVIANKGRSVRIPESQARVHPEFADLVQDLYDRYKAEGSVSRGTRTIAPNLFIGEARRGYFNFGRNKNIILVYSYTGPRDYLPVLIEEMCQYCAASNLEVNFLADEEITAVGGMTFSATPFGVLQRIKNLKGFSLEGQAMRRLRYQVSKFNKSGKCTMREHRCGSDQTTDQQIGEIIDLWCQSRTMINPLIYEFQKDVLAGTLNAEHRVFLTDIDGAVQNVILITAMAASERGYLMDLEFYRPDMPLGGLEFGIVHIIEALVAEGCDLLSMGATYGCKIGGSSCADPEIERILDDLRDQKIFNDESNLQFKNKFRPESKPIFLCRPAGRGNPDNVLDVIMMIADPDKNRTPSDEARHTSVPKDTSSAASLSKASASAPSDETPRAHILSEFGFNPINIPHGHVDFDLKTDSWAQLKMPVIEAQMQWLRGQLQEPIRLDESVKELFPFAHYVLTNSGQAAETIFFKAWPKKGVVLQNLLFPSTIFSQINEGFTPIELPHPDVFDLASEFPYKGNMDWDALSARLMKDPDEIALACIELSDNAAGGFPVSLEHLKKVKALLAGHSVPLVIDGTRVVESAQFLIEHEREHAGKSVWAVIREILSCGDAVIASLSKDFRVNRGGLIALNDSRLFARIQDLGHECGAVTDLMDSKIIGASLQDRRRIEAGVVRRMENVRRIWAALKEHKIPVVSPTGVHCVLIDVKAVPDFRDLKYPVASFLAWIYLNTGIRAAAHNAGMQQGTAINDLVRLAIPVGLKRDQVDTIIERLVRVFEEKANIPEVELASRKPLETGSVRDDYKLIKYHNVSDDSKPRVQNFSASPTPAADSSASLTIRAENAKLGVVKGREAQDIAIIGMAGRYPKASNPRKLWENLANGRDCIEEISGWRYEWRLRHGESKRYRGGFIDDVDKFDSLFFNISPREAELLDCQERLFLEVAWEAIEDAGYYPEVLNGDGSRNIGVFVGAVWATYQMLGAEEKHLGNAVAPNSFLWSIANRVSYWMNFSGPSLTVDTACSSSLTAVHLACEAIRSGECSAALVGGVNLDLHQAKLDINELGGALSVDGVCRSFGKGANGYVAGEGVGALLLKRLDRAVEAGDHIYGVIKSAVVNHGGRASGYTVPNPKAQADVILSAIKKSGIDARTLGYIEAHGTGTALGDPIEIAGLTEAFKADNVESQTCAIGSIKTNIGHLEAAAGVVSISKVLLQMQHRQYVPSLHSSELNEFIDFKNSPFYVVQRREQWNPKEIDGVRFPLRAGISSFGAGGSNAHVIVEEYQRSVPGNVPRPQGKLIFPLSARSQDQLQESAARLKGFLEDADVDLRDVSYTLQIGRKSFEHRVALVAPCKRELLEALVCFIEGKKAQCAIVGNGTAADGFTRLLDRQERAEFISLVAQRRDPEKLATLWAEGLLPDWTGVAIQIGRSRVPLPTYPFADKRHWICRESTGRRLQTTAAALHPLIDTNESTFERQVFKKTLSERDFFICDHRVAGIPTLPGVAYLELARKAGEIAAGRPVRIIRHVLWVSPLVVRNSAPKDIFIELKPSGDSVQFQVFSQGPEDATLLHAQGTLLYAPAKDAPAAPERIDLESIRARCIKRIEGNAVYPNFSSLGLNLGPSFQVVQEVFKGNEEVLGVLTLPELRHADLESMVLHPSLVDGSLQAGMAAQLGEAVGEMLVPYSIGEVEILHPLQAACYSYATNANKGKDGGPQKSRVLKSNVLIVDQAGKVLVKIRESTGVPLRDVQKKAEPNARGDQLSTLYYSYDWEKAVLELNLAELNEPRSILLFDTGETLRDLFVERIRKLGAGSATVTLVRPGPSYQWLDRNCYSVNPSDQDDLVRLFDSLVERNEAVENICFAWPLDRAKDEDWQGLKESLEQGVLSFLFVCQNLIRHRLESKARLVYLYSEAEAHNQAMAGFVNTLRIEHPRLLAKTVEVRRTTGEYSQVFDAALAELQARAQDATAIRYDGQDRYTRILKPIGLEQASPPNCSASLKEKGVYLITGGAGGLGLVFAEFLARNCRAKLVLVGRSELSPKQEARISELRDSGAEAEYIVGDVSNPDDVARVIRTCKARFDGINGVIHAAGVLRDSYLRNKTAEEMRAVFGPKLYGTIHLDAATRNEPLDLFVTFSSLAAITGNAGQSDYGFANSFMDAFVAERERRRLNGTRSGKSVSINWALWADGGMKPDEQTEAYLTRTLGIRPLSTATGLDAFVRGLAADKAQFAVLEGNPKKLELAWNPKKKVEVVSTVTAEPAKAVSTATDPNSAKLARRVQEDLSQIVMELLKLDPSDMSTDKVLLDMGFDSMGLTRLANTINEKYQLDITPVLFFDYPSVDEIAKYLFTERAQEIQSFYECSGVRETRPASPAVDLEREHAQPGAAIQIKKGWAPAAFGREDGQPSGDGRSFSKFRFVKDPIAIVGMSGTMPQSDDLEEFWDNLENSRDLITVIPRDRWLWEDYFGDPLKEINKSNSKWGGFMREVDKFDPLFFGISPREAQMMDPQQRIFLQTVWKAIEDSGHKASDLSGTKTGVFVGVATNDYSSMMTSLQVPLDAYTASGNTHSVLANRVSFLLNLRGPSAPLDTACSSSLVALHRAIESIHTGSCDMAIVGGVQVMLNPGAYISFSMAGMLSPDGKCKTFDKGANGYVRGEGAGAVLLKRLGDAVRDGDNIYAVIKATAENHGGRVTTMTAPNASAQSALLIEAYEKAQIDPTTLGYIECHGTGTSLGDPIEIQALTRTFSELYKKYDRTAKTPHCGLGSVKTNIGHLETAAGIASVLKVLLALKHHHIPANIHFEQLNPYINLKGTPFYIVDKLTPWAAPVGEDGLSLPRRAGVSSFGFGGANTHIVLEEYVAPVRLYSEAGNGPQLIVLSAKNEDRLVAYVASISAYLEKHDVELTDFAFTLQVGRDEMPERLAMVVSSTSEMKEKFAEINRGGVAGPGSYRGKALGKAFEQQTEEMVRALIERHDLSRLAELWVLGLKIDWHELHAPSQPRRISIPTYPFARERHWIPGEPGGTSKRQITSGTDQLHPLIQRNVSTLKDEKFASRFDGSEFYLADHRLKTTPVLPAVAYIEMATVAGELAGEQRVRIIRNMVWSAPLTAADGYRDVEIALSPGQGDVQFTVRSSDRGNSVIHCRGMLGYSARSVEPDTLNIDEIKQRCSADRIAGHDLYLFLSTSGLELGRSFQVVQSIDASSSECLAVLQLPEHLIREANQFRLHPCLLDGAVHTVIGMVKRARPAAPWSIPYSAGEIEIFQPLNTARYAHASWDMDGVGESGLPRIQLHLLDKNGQILVRIRDFVAKAVVQEQAGSVQSEGGLYTLVPAWSPVHFDITPRSLPEPAEVLVLGTNESQFEWVKRSYSKWQTALLARSSSMSAIEDCLTVRPIEHLVWNAPDLCAGGDGNGESDKVSIEGQEDGVLTIFRVIQLLLRLGYATKRLRWTILTGRTQRVLQGEPVRPTHAGIVGLIGSLAKEYPQWDLRLLDVDSLSSATAEECFSLPWDKQGNVLARRDGQWFQQGLSIAEVSRKATPVYRKSGVYVVIGGAGGLGEVWSRFLIERFQANVVWIGRRPQDEAISDKIKALAKLGPTPLYISADATKLAALEDAREVILKKYAVIHGVVHSAAVLNDHSFAAMDESAFKATFSSSVESSVNIDRVLGDQPLDFMLFFSSIISFFKTPGQSNYAAGCTFKDSFAQKLQQVRPYPVKIMNWGYWGGVGLAADEFHRKLMEQLGIGSIEPEDGLAALDEFMKSDRSQLILIKTINAGAPVGSSLSEIVDRYQDRVAKSLLPQPAAGPGRTVAKTHESPATMKDFMEGETARTTEPAEAMGAAYVRGIITENLSDALRIDAGLIHADAPFADYGVDSISGASFIRALSERLQIELQAIDLFEYKTVNQFAKYITVRWPEQVARQVGEIGNGSGTRRTNLREAMNAPEAAAARFLRAEVDSSQLTSTREMVFEPIAIIGMSGRFAQSESLDAFWRNLKEGNDLVKEVSRWRKTDCVTSETVEHAYCYHGSYIDSADRFDASFFGISSTEATYMDPQQRLFLEESWRALEDAGYAGRSVREKDCGVYVGCGSSNYGDLFGRDTPPQAWWGNAHSIIPARIAYHLNLRGPALAVDSACSSSLAAIHLACESLWTRDTEMALAGGVYIQATPGFHQIANRAGMLSTDGKCSSFDAKANGFVPGEAVGVVVLKRLEDALSAGDHLYGVIAGSGINQNGSSNGIIAPNASAQERLLGSVYDRFKIRPESIQVVEAHGTGTLLGDSIEHLALSRTFRKHTDKRQFCAIGSVKTNLGHAGNASGIASTLKVLLALQHRQIPPSLHFKQASPAVDFESSPFYVNTELRDWTVKDNAIRRAAVSSFGFNGTNAHLVIEEPPAVQISSVQSPAYLIALSARTPDQLKRQVENLIATLPDKPGLSMNDLSFSLLLGRTHFVHRLCCVADTQEELARSLREWNETGSARHIYCGTIAEGRIREQPALKRFGNYCIQECRRAIDVTSYIESLGALAELHVQGYDLDFDTLFPKESRRMPLPTYPFAGERYWVDVPEQDKPAPETASVDNLLLHGTTSTSGEVRYSFTVAGAEPPVGETWILISTSGEPASAYDALSVAEKVELILKHEIALQLRKPMESIPSDQSYFDLGLTSLGFAHVVQRINELLKANLSPSVVFEHRDIRSLAAYLADNHQAAIGSIILKKQNRDGPSGTAAQRPTAVLTTLPRKEDLEPQEACLTAEQAVGIAPDAIPRQVIESIMWNEDALSESYEKVTF